MTSRPLILSYHAVSDTWPSKLAIRHDVLRGQLRHLARRGYVGLTLSEAERRRREGTLPERAVVVTFDDGYASTLSAKPVLDEFGFPGTIFVVTRFVGSDRPMVWPGLEVWSNSRYAPELMPIGWKSLEGLVAAGWEIGSHTVNHRLLTDLPQSLLERELGESRALIIERLGSCSSLAYPYGVSDTRVERAAAAAEYDVACTLSFSHRRDDPYTRPRLELTTDDTGPRLFLQLNAIRPFRRTRGAMLLRKLRLGEHWLDDRFSAGAPEDGRTEPDTGPPAAAVTAAEHGSPSSLAANAPEVAAAIDPRLRVVHDVRSSETAGGGDVDCFASRGDDLWPLRLNPDWRVCQQLRYDVGSSYWVIEHDDSFFAVDVVHDPRGLGQYGFPTGLAFERPETEEIAPGSFVEPALAAAYLTSKRLRKGIDDYDEWQRIGGLARTDRQLFATTLESVMGADDARVVSAAVLERGRPGPEVRRRGRRAIRAHRLRTAERVCALAAAQAQRVAGRILRPTGLVVVIVGPDGTGKSTLARALPGVVDKPFRRFVHYHFRVGILPRPGALVRRPARDVSRPQEAPPHGAAISMVLLFYHWVDACLGAWLRLGPLRLRAGLAVVERGWWDVQVDPARYRLDVPEPLVRLLGRLIPRPDLVLVLSADPDVILERKSELSRAELVRQLDRWEQLAPPDVAITRLDTGRTHDDVLRQAREAVVGALEHRCLGRLGYGWVAYPRSQNPRLLIPRGSRKTTLRALAVYNPHTKKARSAWRLARSLASVGGFRLLRRGVAPPPAVRHAVAPYVPPLGTYSVAESTYPGRYTALVLDERSEVSAFIKIATDARGRRALAHEAAALDTVADLLLPPLRAPRMRDFHDGVLVVEPVRWALRKDPVELTPEVAYALGRFFRAGAKEEGSELVGLAHGDCAPWNLLHGEGGWLLVDWEAYWDAAPPFFDVFHYVVQTHANLGRPQLSELNAGFSGSGWFGEALDAYADGADVDRSEAPRYFRSYLRVGQEDARVMNLLGPMGVNVRKRLLEAWDNA